MKKIISFLLLIVIGSLYSQTNRFIYQLDMKVADRNIPMNMVLDIDKNFVKFYDYKFLEIDSLRTKTGNNIMTNTMSDQLLIRKRNSYENKAFHDNNFDYLTITSTDRMNWKIEKETKKVQGYKLQKATTNFGGRAWTAWFCDAIPFQEGPYKFRGLPGLIFEIADANKDFSYSLVKSKNLPKTFDTTRFLETHYGEKPIPITLKQYHKIKLDYYNDPTANMSQTLKNGGSVNINGQDIKTQDELDQRRKVMQEMIRKYYNPIELDKAIPYPKK